MQVVGCTWYTEQAPTVPVSVLPPAALHSWIHYSWAYICLGRIRTLGLAYECLDMKNNFPSSSMPLFLCSFQLNTLGKFFVGETPLPEVALCQHSIWHCILRVMARIFGRAQARRLGAQFLLRLDTSLLSAHQHLCHATDAQGRHFLLATNLGRINRQFSGTKLSVSAVCFIYLDFSLKMAHQ